MNASVAGVPGLRRVLVVDENRLFGELLVRAVDGEPGLQGVGHARSDDALRQAALLRPDVVVTDLRLTAGSEDGITLARGLVRRHPGLLVVVLTTDADQGLVRRAGPAGVAAVLRKDGPLVDLLDTLKRLGRGHMVLHPDLLTSGLLPAQREGSAAPLTPRERQVLELLAGGADPFLIARRLGISVNTCRGHVKSLRLKLGAHTQLEAVVMASRRGLVRVGTS